MSERRSEIRLALPEYVVSGARGSGRILDVSSSGVGVEVKTKCFFARGELHRLVLSSISESVEVEGQVRWTQSDWRTSPRENGSEYFQTAGFAFSKLLTTRPTGIWSSLLEGLARPVEPAAPAVAPAAPRAAAPTAAPAAAPTVAPIVAPAEEQRVAPVRRPSPLNLLEPIDGSTVTQDSTKVIFTIDSPESITRIRINGIDASVRGDLGTAEVELQKGANRIVSMVTRRDGTYSTYVLGQLDRSRTH